MNLKRKRKRVDLDDDYVNKQHNAQKIPGGKEK